METFSLLDMNADELYALGEQIGNISITRPDITHQILVGVRDKVADGPIPNGYGFGELFESLWRWWHHRVANETNKTPPIPFERRARPSGIGETVWRFQK